MMKEYIIMKKCVPLLLCVCLLLAASASWAEPATEESAPLTAPGYVLVTTYSQLGWLALPAPGEEDVVFPLWQQLPDGTQVVNVIHLTPEGVYVEDATCENHDCVDQGLVTLENREERILGNMIICLPNQLMLQLYTAEEVEMLVSMGYPSPEAASPSED